MKHLRLFLVAIAAMFGLGVSAQSWTPPTISGEDPVSGETYKIFNVEATKGMAMGKAWFGWATTAILDGDGIDFTVNQDGANWKFFRTSTQGVFTSGNGINGDAMHVDNTPNAYGITKLPNGYYHIHDAGGNENSTCWGYNPSFHATGVVAHANASAEGWMCDWVFLKDVSVIPLYSARVKLYNLLLTAYNEGVDTNAASAVYENATATVDELNSAYTALNQARFENKLAIASDDNPQDITEFVLKNADFSDGTIGGWETNYVKGQQAENIGYQGASYSNGTIVISQFIEAWKPGATLGNGYLRQTVQGLPEGKYVLEADGISAWQNDDSRVITGAYLYINAAGVDYKTAMSTRNNLPQHFTAQFLSPGDVDVTFGLKTESATCNWLCADNFKVKFYGIDLSPYATLLADAVAQAQALQGSIPTAAYQALTDVVAENNKEWSSSKEYTDAIAAIQSAIENAKAAKSALDRYNEVKAACVAVNSGLDTSEADAVANAAATAEGFETAVASVRAALLASLPEMEIAEGGYIDVTNAIIDNASVRQNTDYWTIYNYPGYPDNVNSNGKCAYEECEFYQQQFKFYQTLALVPGTWEFGVTGFHRAGNHATYFYAGEDKILIPGVPGSGAEGMGGIEWVNTMEQAKTYFDGGNGKVALKFLVETAGNIEIGIDNQDTETDKWTIFRDFTLKYYGAVDYSIYENAWNEAVASANAEISANPNVTGEELAAVQAAILDAPDGSSKANYLEKTNALVAATEAFIAAAPAYDAYAAEKAIAQMIGVTPGEEDPTTAAAAAAGVNNLKVAEFEYVTANYPNDNSAIVGSFADWTKTAISDGQPDTPQTLDGEHWSGKTSTYYEQGINGWAATNFEVEYTMTTKLPAGEYVLKVAGRSSADVTGIISSSATENTVKIANVGAFAKGIDLDGKASFEGENFARDGQGYGWEWRYLPFTLTEKGNVTLTIKATTNKEHNWVSIADATILSKEPVVNEVELFDLAEAAPEAEYADKVTYARTLVPGFNTLVLPFNVKKEELGENVLAIYAYGGSNITGEGDNAIVHLVFSQAVTSLAQNKPYIVKVKENSSINGLEFEKKNIQPAENPTITDANFDFVGTYVALPKGNETIVAGDYISVAAGLKAAAGGNKLNAFRAYLKKKAEVPAGAKVAIQIGDDIVDGIEAAQILNNIDGTIYNLNGQKVSNAQKGIFIQNGKKVVIK